MQEKNNKWTLKNVITLAIFTVIIFILMMLVTIVTNVLFTPVGAYFAGPGAAALLAGPFFMVMVNKIEKRGVTFLLSLITGLLFLVMGQLYTFIVYAVFGLLAELFFITKASYQKLIHNIGAFFIYMLAFSAGGFIPMFLIREQFIAWYQTVGSEESVSAMINVYGTVHGVLITTGITIAGCVAGCLIGRSILNRHVKKARI
jgi:energy-coupling factor transport system substrate-specific component